MTDKQLLALAVERYGQVTQIDMVIEECAELIHAIQKHRRGGEKPGDTYRLAANLVEEGVDVELCLEQLKAIMGEPVLWNNYRELKLNRLAVKLGVTYVN